MLQVVYVLTNPAMPGLIKIGKTYADDVGIRLGQLYTTGVPLPFDLAFACKVHNADEVEKALHRAFAPNRVNPKREYFKMEAEQAIAILKLLHVEDATVEVATAPTDISGEEIAAANQYKSKRPIMNFTEMSIPIGAVLHFRDGDATATVISPRKVLFNGEEQSLTSATQELLQVDYSVQPSPYWTYNGKWLRDIYDETYNTVG